MDTKILYTEESAGKAKSLKALDFDVLVTTTTNLQYMLENECFAGLSHKVTVSDIIVDKVDLHSALDLDEELIKVGNEIQQLLSTDLSQLNVSKTLITTNEQETEDVFDKVKSAFLNERKAVIVKLKDQKKSATMYESAGHLVVE